MNTTCYAIAVTLFSSMGQGQSHYTKSSINTLRKNLVKFHTIDVGRRWVFQCLKNMLTAGLITRKSRYRHDATCLISQIPSLYSFTISGIKFLVSKRVTGAAKLLKNMIAFVTGKDQRWPKKENIAGAEPFERYIPSAEDWKNLHEIVPKEIS